jgi:hypothetical protein
VNFRSVLRGMEENHRLFEKDCDGKIPRAGAAVPG